MINKLEMLIALAREKHFGRAAASLGIAQPTLSSGIKQLEDQLGAQLVRRGSRFGGLTPEGQRALEHARRICEGARRMRAELRPSDKGLSGRLRLAVIPTALTWAARLATTLEARHPNIALTILSRSSREIRDMMEAFDVDAGLTYLSDPADAAPGDDQARPLYAERYAILCARSHPAAAMDAARWADLGDLRLCLLTPDMQNRRIIDRNFREAGAVPGARIESNSTVALAAIVQEGGWATILPRDMCAWLAQGKDLAAIPVEGGAPPPPVGLVAPRQDPPSPVLEALFAAADRIAETR
ncbi:LysR family transcriptional regulator [Rhodovulum sp. DZ06]|uniref:LysR family transcriptional regulator n=1 Tax=Rhodovulum sp. DZ06 TaxID=3425126 RepID=UPI003D329265